MNEQTLEGCTGFNLIAPVSGTAVPLDQVPDPVFSQKIIGDGLAIEPSDGKMCIRDRTGVAPTVVPIRGGTDGARLSYMGLPCPNLCAGGENFHGVHEFASVQSLEKIVEILIQIVKDFEAAGFCLSLIHI